MDQADDILAKAQEQKGKNKGVDNDDIDEDLPHTKTGLVEGGGVEPLEFVPKSLFFSKTMINSSQTDTHVDPPGPDGVMYPQEHKAFMAALEADANERAARRKANEKEANILKEKGNEEFRQGNYNKALALYTEGLTKIKDHTALWTNRAQTNIKLCNYEEAIKDCDWALRVFPNSLKAHIHMGRAHLGLKNYDKARECYKEALACDPKKTALIADYISEVDRAEKASQEEVKAQEVFESGETGVVPLLEKVNKKEQLPVYYSGGFRFMCSFLRKTEDKTLFRTQGGFSIVTEHPCFSKCLSASPRSLSQEELDMLLSGVDMLQMACFQNETNQEILMQTDGLPEKLLRFMEVKLKGQGRLVKASCLELIHTVTLTEIGRTLVIQKFDLSKLLTVLFNLIRTNANLAVSAGCCLNNLALEKRFKLQLRDKIEDNVIPAFESLLKDSSSPKSALPSCVTTMLNLANDSIIRDKLTQRKDLWNILIDFINSHKGKLDEPISVELVEACLGLLANITNEPTALMRECGVNICRQCLEICKNLKHYKLIVSRSLGVLSHVLPNCIPAVEWWSDNGGVDILLYTLKNDDDFSNRKHALKALTGCTQINDHARIFTVDHKGLGTLIKLLKSEDEVVIGNAALCLGHTTQVPKVCAALTKTDILKDLLVLARDGTKPGLQKNCAILIAKLAQGDTR
ncbi:hypothetical protein FSP39_016660 [Pinctada imbricata]|uniref:Protein unc-45 homolog B n=1 Tax=Pinctada imbricata TaxID=66713 RepID=A0AA89CAZ2_PINIB|nr:hypothetical protein FSP39_016660 [Pinctada imbricata]